jgi:hypothetical protein
MVSMSDELKERNILKMILIVRFACAILDVEHPIYSLRPAQICIFWDFSIESPDAQRRNYSCVKKSTRRRGLSMFSSPKFAAAQN